VHVEKAVDGRLQLTVVPLLYGTYALKQGSGTFSLEPPPDLNMDPGLPVIKGQALQEGLKKFALYRRDRPVAATDASPNAPPAPATPELVRVDTVAPGQPVPETGAMPSVAVATPVPAPGQHTPKPIAVVKPASTPPLTVTMLTTPVPRAAITPIPATNPPTARPRVSPDGVPLQPFIAAQRDPNMTNSGATWRTYAPGQVPPARAISLDEVGALAEKGDIGERMYLRGEFRVTASGTSRAVLRDAKRSDGESPRVVVEYPAGAVPPQEQDRFVRDASRPYLISDVRRGADGVVTIYVREIISQ
jgi:hypothetical protein